MLHAAALQAGVAAGPAATAVAGVLLAIGNVLKWVYGPTTRFNEFMTIPGCVSSTLKHAGRGTGANLLYERFGEASTPRLSAAPAPSPRPRLVSAEAEDEGYEGDAEPEEEAPARRTGV